MGVHSVRKDLDQLTEEWRVHRGAEVALLRGQQQLAERINELAGVVEALGLYVEAVERRVNALSQVPS